MWSLGCAPPGERERNLSSSAAGLQPLSVFNLYVVILLQVCLAYLLTQSIWSSLAPFAALTEHLGNLLHVCRRTERRFHRTVRLTRLRWDSQRFLAVPSALSLAQMPCLEAIF